MPVEILADAIVVVDGGSRRLFVDLQSKLIFRETTPEAIQSCRPLRELWESGISSSRVVHWLPNGFIETLVSGTPVIGLQGHALSMALQSAVKQLVGLQGIADLGIAEPNVERGLEILKFANLGDHLRRLHQLETILARSPLVPAGSDNAPQNALFRNGEVVFVDVCPVIKLPAFVRPLGLVAAWTAASRNKLASYWNTVMRTELAEVLQTQEEILDDELIHSLTYLAVACDGTLDLPLADAFSRFSWLIGAYRL